MCTHSYKHTHTHTPRDTTVQCDVDHKVDGRTTMCKTCNTHAPTQAQKHTHTHTKTPLTAKAASKEKKEEEVENEEREYKGRHFVRVAFQDGSLFFFLQTKAQTASASHLHVVLSTSLTPTQIIFNIAPSAFIHPDN